MDTERRSFGLDGVRAVAITLVTAAHFAFLLPGPWLYAMTFLGSAGVEMFFSLSGFLIGRMLLELTPAGLPAFLARRWLRTLPLFYAVLAAHALAQGWLSVPTALFVQALVPGHAGFMPVAWSLAVEEWFYLLFPLALAGLRVLRPRGRGGDLLALAVVVIAASSALRMALFAAGVMPVFHAVPPLRLDACAFGVAAAALLRVRPGVQRWVPAGVAVPAFGLLLAFMGTQFVSEFGVRLPVLPATQDWRTAYFGAGDAILDAGAAVLVLALAPARGGGPGWIVAGVTWISRISYSVYLLHLPLIVLLTPPLAARFGMGIGAPLILAAVLAASSASYLLIERPVLRWRDRRIGGGGAAPPPLLLLRRRQAIDA